MDPTHGRLTRGYGFTPTRRNDTYPTINPLKLELSGKNVLITGAARGLGKAMALSYAKAGASGIAIIDLLDSTAVEKECLEAAKAAGRSQPSIICLKVDIRNLAAVEQAAKAIQSKFDSLDIIINNAGYLAPYEPLVDSDPEKWWASWEVNVRGPYHIAKAFLPFLLKSNDKTMIVISSVGAHHTLLGGSSYETTKLAVLKINNYLMLEYGDQGLLVYAVAPGGVHTDMAASFPKDALHLLTDTPQLVADTITFLTKERRDWLAARYVDSRWDMEELLQKKETIIRDDLLKVKMRV